MFSPNKIFSLLIAGTIATALTCCGSGSGSGASDAEGFPLTALEGTLVDKSNRPVADAEVYLYETNESSITDDEGRFSLQSFKHLGSASVYFRTDKYTNRSMIENIPDNTMVVRFAAVLDKTDNSFVVSELTFDTDASPEPVDPTPLPGNQATPTPGRTPTPKPGNFDANGNTSAFGIPSGLKGNINAGSNVWSAECASCHAAEKPNRVYGQIKASIRVIPEMQALRLTNQQLANVTAYLNRGRQ